LEGSNFISLKKFAQVQFIMFGVESKEFAREESFDLHLVISNLHLQIPSIKHI